MSIQKLDVTIRRNRTFLFYCNDSRISKPAIHPTILNAILTVSRSIRHFYLLPVNEHRNIILVNLWQSVSYSLGIPCSILFSLTILCHRNIEQTEIMKYIAKPIAAMGFRKVISSYGMKNSSRKYTKKNRKEKLITAANKSNFPYITLRTKRKITNNKEEKQLYVYFKQQATEYFHEMTTIL